MADNAAVFSHFVGDLLQRENYAGAVDLGVLVAPLSGTVSAVRERAWGGEPYAAAS